MLLKSLEEEECDKGSKEDRDESLPQCSAQPIVFETCRDGKPFAWIAGTPALCPPLIAEKAEDGGQHDDESKHDAQATTQEGAQQAHNGPSNERHARDGMTGIGREWLGRIPLCGHLHDITVSKILDEIRFIIHINKAGIRRCVCTLDPIGLMTQLSERRSGVSIVHDFMCTFRMLNEEFWHGRFRPSQKSFHPL